MSGAGNEDCAAVEMWKLEWWAGATSERMGTFHDEYVEGDEVAHSRLMQLTVDQLLSTRNRPETPHHQRRRISAWLRAHPVDNGTKGEDWQHVDRVNAWRLVDGVWCEAKWTLTPPDIDVLVEPPHPPHGSPSDVSPLPAAGAAGEPTGDSR